MTLRLCCKWALLRQRIAIGATDGPRSRFSNLCIPLHRLFQCGRLVASLLWHRFRNWQSRLFERRVAKVGMHLAPTMPDPKAGSVNTSFQFRCGCKPCIKIRQTWLEQPPKPNHFNAPPFLDTSPSQSCLCSAYMCVCMFSFPAPFTFMTKPFQCGHLRLMKLPKDCCFEGFVRLLVEGREAPWPWTYCKGTRFGEIGLTNSQ